MAALHATAAFNVYPSINKAYADALLAYTGLPAWMTLPATVFNWPDIESHLPCFSFVHFTGTSNDEYQGRVATATESVMRNTGLLEISAWVSRDQRYNNMDVWASRLIYMQGMLEEVNTKKAIVPIFDFETNPNSPSSAGYRVVMSSLREESVMHDPNPAIERKRFLINYQWHQRATI